MKKVVATLLLGTGIIGVTQVANAEELDIELNYAEEALDRFGEGDQSSINSFSTNSKNLGQS